MLSEWAGRGYIFNVTHSSE